MSDERPDAPHGLDPSAYEAIDGDAYQPVVPPTQAPMEFTWRAVGLGILLGGLFGAANAYLALKVGITVSASIPAAVMAVFFFRFLRSSTLLESNMVQTVGSAGESVAAGVVFTIPAFFLWMQTDPAADPGRLKIFMLALSGGILGVLFMIPLRRYLIVREHGKLGYPEGTACAEVLVSSQAGASKATLLFQGLGLGAVYQFLMHEKWLSLWHKEAKTDFRDRYHIGMEVSPELLGVGYIVGPRIAGLMLGGAVLGVLVLVPLISYFRELGGQPLMAPEDIRGTYVKLIGAGAVACGGIITLIKSLPTLVQSFRAGVAGLTAGRNADGAAPAARRTQRDLPLPWVLGVAVAVVLLMWLLPDSILPVGPGGALAILVFAFVFVTVSSRIVGLIGSSSNPVSGMTIATLLITASLFVAFGAGPGAKYAVLSVGAVVCIAAAIAGDTSQDLKTGFLVGATPRAQQIGEFVGVATSALIIAFVIYLFKADIVAGDLQAPQANLMRTVIDGVMGGDMPWALLVIGGFAAVVVELLGMNSLAFAVGLYLPIELSTPIMAGGLVRAWTNHRFTGRDMEERRERGVLFGSGLIAGAALIGVLVALLVSSAEWSEAMGAFVTRVQDLTDGLHHGWPLLFFLVLVVALWHMANGRRRERP
ncbi:MAG: oligopeptide transporter, OPT family [Candidatus Krumholzibacteriota bacterium]|nr:oligopeptide transporter, OPT family [Candidatus Krumholzibacteriota bacterium]